MSSWLIDPKKTRTCLHCPLYLNHVFASPYTKIVCKATKIEECPQPEQLENYKEK